MKILIITGGTTSERRISFMSAKQVKTGLEEVGHKVKLFDLKKGRITKDLVKKFDVIFPVLHGEEGEGGNLQKKLSALGVPFVGGNPEGFKQGWYKIPFKKFCEENNILTSPWKIIKGQSDIVEFSFPSVLKSSSGGSSREVIILKSSEDLKNNLYKKLLRSNLTLFVERYLPGIEVTVGILADKALPVIEIIPPAGGWFDYKNKYWGSTREIPNAPSLTPKLKKIIQEIALKIHRALELGHYSRIDFIVSDNQPYVLEVNTIPGLTASSLFPKAAQAAGISFPKILDRMVKLAISKPCKLHWKTSFQTFNENIFLKPNNPLLKKVAEEVSKGQLNSPKIRKIAKVMLEILKGEQKGHKRGVGLAAPQIGISKRIISVDVKADGKGRVGDLIIYINPKIIWKSKKEEEWYEGCYSTGRICGIVSRPTSIKIQAIIIKLPGRNITTKTRGAAILPPRGWKFIEKRYSGYTARIFQHEIDHLDGKLFIDHIKNPDHLHRVKANEFSLYRNKEAWRNWPKKHPLPLA